MEATNGARMRRILAVPGLALASIALAACAPGSLDADPPAASGTSRPSPSPSPSPSATPEPTPEGQRFDDVDLAAALVPLPAEFGEPERWGEWTTQPREQILPGLDAAAFAAAPECASAVETLVALEPGQVVHAGYPYDGTLVTSVLVARFADPASAAAYVSAAEAAGVACQDVQGSAVEQYGVVALRGIFEPSQALDDAGFGFVAEASDGSNHYYGRVLAAHDELVLVGVSDMMMMGWDERQVADLETQISALDAAVGG